MSTKVLIAAAVIATGVLGLQPGTALANKLVYSVTGTVSTVPIGSSITVNGRTYPIASGSAAVQQVQQVIQGETVRVTLDGPPAARSTEVVMIHVSSSR